MADDSVMTLKSASGGVPSEFSYRGQKTYHVTLHAFQKKPVFADRAVIPAVLDALRDGALAADFEVILYTILPDRVVLLIHGRTDESDMKGFLGVFRTNAAAAVEGGLGHRLWKRTYLERVLRRGERPEHSVREIAGLAVRAGLATEPESYEFTGSFVTDVAKLLPQRRPAPQGRIEGRRPPDARHGPEGRRPTQSRRGPGRGRPFEPRRGPQGGPPQGAPRGPERGRPPHAHRGSGGGRPFEPRRGPDAHRPPDAGRGPGGQRGPGGHRPPAGRRPGFKPGSRRPGGRPPTSPRGRPRR